MPWGHCGGTGTTGWDGVGMLRWQSDTGMRQEKDGDTVEPDDRAEQGHHRGWDRCQGRRGPGVLWGMGMPRWGRHKDARAGWGPGHGHGAGDTLTRCLQPASLKGHSSMAVLQLSLRWVGTSSRAMLGVPHWLGQGTGYRGHWYWWFWGQRVTVSQGREPAGQGSPWAPSHLDGVEDELLGAVGAGLGALGALGQRVLGQQAPHHARPALVLAVHALLGTRALVALGTAAASSPSGCPRDGATRCPPGPGCAPPWRPPPRLCPYGQAVPPQCPVPPPGSPMATLHPTSQSPSWLNPRGAPSQAMPPRHPCPLHPPYCPHPTPLPAASPILSPPWPYPPPAPTSKASPVKSLAQNSHLTRRLGQPCWTCSGRSRRLSLALHRLGQGMTLKPQVPRWAWGAQGR